jgi:hypothetical protein
VALISVAVRAVTVHGQLDQRDLELKVFDQQVGGQTRVLIAAAACDVIGARLAVVAGVRCGVQHVLALGLGQQDGLKVGLQACGLELGAWVVAAPYRTRTVVI